MTKIDKVLYEGLGEQLRENREKRGYSLEQVAQAVGLTKKTIQRYETAESRITTDNLKAICGFLGIEISSITRFFYFDFSQEPENVTHVDLLDHLENNEQYGNHKENLEFLKDKPDLLDLYVQIHDSETLKLMFDSVKDLTPSDLEMVLTIIKGIRKERGLD